MGYGFKLDGQLHDLSFCCAYVIFGIQVIFEESPPVQMNFAMAANPQTCATYQYVSSALAGAYY